LLVPKEPQIAAETSEILNRGAEENIYDKTEAANALLRLCLMKIDSLDGERIW